MAHHVEMLVHRRLHGDDGEAATLAQGLDDDDDDDDDGDVVVDNGNLTHHDTVQSLEI